MVMKNLSEFYKNKKVFVTGHTGFKGSWLCEVLLHFGANVKGYALKANTEPALFEVSGLAARMNSVIADIRDLARLQKEIADFQPDIVLHLAAQPLVRESYKAPVVTYETNVMGTVNLLEACRGVSSIKSIVNVTTDKVYENKEWEWGYREHERLCGFDPYSNSKSCSELVTHSYKNCFYNMSDSPALSTARSGNVIGGGDFSTDRIIPDCVSAAVADREIVVRNPHSTRPYQHVLECLRGYLLLAALQYEDKSYAGNYNFGPDDESCVATGVLVDLFCKKWRGAKWVNKSDNGPHEANFLKLDCAKAKKILGWYPVLDIERAISLTTEWSMAYYKGKNIIGEQIKKYFG